MSIIASAPLLSGLKTKGGTFYSFSTTVNDFSYLFSDSTIRLVPSKFVALKLPKWSNTSDQHMFRNPTDIGTPAVTDPNIVFPKILQNYTENLIQYSEADRTDNKLSNYAEASFWKTLRMLGGMTLVDTGTTIVEDGLNKQLYKEEAASVTYDPIIKFVGDVNLLNHSKTGGTEYVEIFVNIPTNQGRMEDILFKPAKVQHTSGAIPVAGGSIDTVGLSAYSATDQTSAIYDDSINKQYSVGNSVDDANVYFDEILSSSATKLHKGDFEFNAIALYYDIFDTTDATKKSTNLWGILVVEDFDGSVGGASNMPLLKKYQPDSIQPGNGYSFRMNLKFSNSTNQVTSEISINDYSTVSMELYMDALRRLTLVTDKVEEIMTITTAVKAENDRMKTTMFNAQVILDNIAKISSMSNDIELLKTGNVGGSTVRISNEELFQSFSNTIEALSSTNQNITLNNIISKRSYLGTLVDPLLNIVEFEDGTRFQWNALTNVWDQI